MAPRGLKKRTTIGIALCTLALVFFTACGGRTKEDIVQKARDVSTRAQLEKALGPPTDIAKLGPMERWTYKASNGEVVFLIVGDTVTLQATGGSSGTK
jgi:hypothetical protein